MHEAPALRRLHDHRGGTLFDPQAAVTHAIASHGRAHGVGARKAKAAARLLPLGEL